MSELEKLSCAELMRLGHRLHQSQSPDIRGVGDELIDMALARMQAGQPDPPAGQRRYAAHAYTRSVVASTSTADDATRSIDGVIATEEPIPEMDYERGEIIPRTLLMSGCVWPKSGQIPLLNCHHQRSSKDVLGSIRGLRVERNVLVGRLFFASCCTDAWHLVRDGHCTDLSAGFRVTSQVYIPPGQSKKIDGYPYQGPLNVATRWHIHEGSLVPIGADISAKTRSKKIR